MRAALREALVLVRAGGRRSLLAGAGVLLAATMLGTAVTVSWSLATGFDRSAKAADLPDVIARFDRERVGEIDAKLRALPNVEATSYRTEITRVRLSGGTGSTRRGVVQVVGPGRRGYAIVAGRDARGDDDVVVERGVARAWHLSVGDTLSFGRFGTARVSGIAVSPDNVAFPLATTARVYVAAQNGLRRGTNMALVWTHDPRRVDITLQQARATSFGVQDLRFITHDGVRVLLDQAAGIVLALLIAFSAVVLGAAGVMLGVAAHADVQRRLSTIGVQRALGFPRATIVGAYALRAAIVALPAAVAGARARRTARRRADRRPPRDAQRAAARGRAARSARDRAGRHGRARRGGIGVARPAGDRAQPRGAAARGGARARTAAAARAAARGPHAARRPAGSRATGAVRGDGRGARRVRRHRRAAARARLSARGAARRPRDAGQALRHHRRAARRPAARGRADPGRARRRRCATRCRAPTPTRWASRCASSASPATTRASRSRRWRLGPARGGPDEAEVGPRPRRRAEPARRRDARRPARVGRRGALPHRRDRPRARDRRARGLRPPRPAPGRAGATPTRADRRPLAARRRPGGHRPAVCARSAQRPSPSAARRAPNREILATLAALLRVVALVTGLVCLYALVQGAHASSRSSGAATIAVLRAGGAGAPTVARLLLGVVLVAAVPAPSSASSCESVVLAPLVGNLAAGYADLVPRASVGQALLVAAGSRAVRAGGARRRATRAARVDRGRAARRMRRALATLLTLMAVALLGCGGDAPAPPGHGRLDGERDVARHDGIRRAGAIGRRAARGPQGPRPGRARGRRGRARALRGRDRRARPRRGVAGPRDVPRPPGRRLHADVPPPGGAHDAGPGRRAARSAVPAPPPDRRGR